MKTCSAPGCRTGYRKRKEKGNGAENTPEPDIDEKIQLFHFPDEEKEPERFQAWLRAIPRKDFVPTSNSRLCAKHFNSADIASSSGDTNRYVWFLFFELRNIFSSSVALSGLHVLHSYPS